MYLHRSADGSAAKIKRGYDTKFRSNAAYRATLPDMMEAAHDAIQGANVPIQQVGIHNFKLPLKYRMAALLAGEAIVLTFFVLMARAGFQVLEVLQGDMLVSLTWVPIQFTQSVIPIGAILFIICQLLSLPGYWKLTAAGISIEHAEIEEEVETELEKNKDRV